MKRKKKIKAFIFSRGTKKRENKKNVSKIILNFKHFEKIKKIYIFLLYSLYIYREYIYSLYIFIENIFS